MTTTTVMARPSSTFTAATWNVFHDTPPEVLDPILGRLRSAGVSLILAQECTDAHVRAIFPARGWRYFFHAPEHVIAWRPEVWTPITFEGALLSPTGYDGHLSGAATGILCDQLGRTLAAMSYHGPAHVQVAHPDPARIRANHETAVSWRKLAKAAQTTGVLFGGDDNVDEAGPWGPWRHMLDAATGLRQVQGPRGTHGRRRIDDFRVRGLRPLEGHVLDGGGDHRVHVREFAWGPR